MELIEKLQFLAMSEERKSYCLHQIANVHSINDLLELLREINQLQIKQRPFFIALEKAYHGKTLGALALTSSEGFREPFYLGNDFNEQTIFISQYIDSKQLEEIIKKYRQDILLISLTKNEIQFTKHTFSLIAGAFAEPIQGEAGIIPLEHSFLALLKKHSLQEDFLLVFDEIQAGMYRTGKLSSGTHSKITADIYTFSKSLGGGVAKIAATTIIQRKYVEDFGFLHTSTFSDDDLSSSIGLEVLDILQEEDSKLHEALAAADYLQTRLEWLRSKYPEAISEIRGKGLLLAIEFKDVMPELGFEFKTICDSNMQGYMMASALLNHEGIRMSPSLSNYLTLRIAPSIHFGIHQAEELFVALSNLCEAITQRDIKYFLSALYPDEDVREQKTPDLITNIEKGKRPLSVFLCHLIDEGHVKKVTRALNQIDGEKLTKKLALSKDIAHFEIYHTQTLRDQTGQEMDIVMLGIPVTSEELKKTFTSRQKYKVVQKVQAALDYAKELGASTVGLGQFTSIVSGNGLYLNSRGMNLTTGNAFTIGLTIQAAIRSAREKNIELEKTTAAVIGAAGNIMSVASSLISDKINKLILIHHSPTESSLKFQEAVKRIINEIITSSADTHVVKTIKEYWSKDINILDFLKLPRIQETLIASSDLDLIKEADIVLCGANASAGFLDLESFKENAIIVDVAVPPTIKKELLSQIETSRPDLTYHMGGVARIPNNISIDFFVFPLGINECYACMAETFPLGFSGEKGLLHIGDLSKKIVQKVEVLADRAGFVLGNYKTKSSL